MTATVPGRLTARAEVAEFAALGVRAFTTTRAAGSFGLAGEEPVGAVMARWSGLLADLRADGAPRLASAGQVHGAAIGTHGDGFTGWLRGHALDGHVALRPGTALAVTIADCTPVFLVPERPELPVALLHAGWRGAAAGILEAGMERLVAAGAEPASVHVHLGPAVCGACYEVGPEVFAALGLPAPARPAPLDLRAHLADRARRLGVRHLSVSGACTRCGGSDGARRFYSHRAGESGRQLAVLCRPDPLP